MNTPKEPFKDSDPFKDTPRPWVYHSKTDSSPDWIEDANGITVVEEVGSYTGALICLAINFFGQQVVTTAEYVAKKIPVNYLKDLQRVVDLLAKVQTARREANPQGVEDEIDKNISEARNIVADVIDKESK